MNFQTFNWLEGEVYNFRLYPSPECPVRVELHSFRVTLPIRISLSVVLADTRRASHVVVFFCKHVYHEDCLPTRDVVSPEIIITVSFPARIGGTPENARTLATWPLFVLFYIYT